MSENRIPSFLNMKVSYGRTQNRQCEGVAIPDQCHGDRIVEIISGDENIALCDGLLTANPDIPIGVVTADCAPICLADEHKIAVLHAGWRGVCKGIISKGLALFDTQTVEVFVGPCIKQFEIKKDDCYDQLVSAFGKDFITDSEGVLTYNFATLLKSLLPNQTVFDGRDTYIDMTLPSYRRDGTTNRLVTIVNRK